MGHEIASMEARHKGWATMSVAFIRLPDGRIVSREVEDHGRAVAVLPYDPVRKTAVVVEQFRAPPFLTLGLEQTLEAIAGIVEAEDDFAAVRREALEEGGLELTDLERIATAWTMPGISTERLTLFLAPYEAGSRVSPGGGVASEDEDIRVIELPLKDLVALMAAGELVDMKTLVLVQALQFRRPELFA